MSGEDFNYLKEAGNLTKNTLSVVNSAYSSISGSLYLAIRNMSGSEMQHSDLDRPLTILGGLRSGGSAFWTEFADGFTAIYSVPKSVVAKQGMGFRQVGKGMWFGVLRAMTMPVNAPLRATFSISTGLRNYAAGKSDHGQRYRYPRYFNEDELMPQYNPLYAHAATALRCCDSGNFAD
jgi:hypothetical protein